MIKKRPGSSRLPLLTNVSGNFNVESWDGPYFRPFSCGCASESKLLPKQALFLDAMEAEGVWIYTLSGHAHYKIGNQQYFLGPETVFSIRKPHQGWLLRSPAGLPWKYLWIHISGNQALPFFEFIHTKFGVVHSLPAACKAVRLARDLISCAQAAMSSSPFYWSEKTFLWLQAWWECAEKYSPVFPTVLDDPAKASRLISFTPGSVKKFAEQMGYSRSYLSRKLKTQWGQTPGKILRNARMREAERLLRTTNLLISDIALKIGFSATASFTRAFASSYHTTPLNYRHSHRGEVNLATDKDSDNRL